MKTIAIANQKGGTGKTTTTYNLGIALTQQGYRVLMVDFDPQGNLSCYCGIPPEKDLDQTITELLMKTSCEKPIENRECVYQTGRKEAAARVDFIPSNLRLAGFELAMGTMMCREVLLKACLEQYNNQYDYCLIDCSPSVGLLLTNALTAANEIIIPMQAQPFSVVGMSQLTSSIANVQRMRDLLTAVKNERLYPIIYVTALYGLRRSEVLGLKWDSINFAMQTLTIRHTVARVTKVVEKNKTKNASSFRSFPLTDDAVRLFKILLQQEQYYRNHFGKDYIDNDYVFTWEDGHPYSPDYVSHTFHKLLKKYDLPHIRFHDLRHTCASMLLSEGYGLKDVQEWLGHSDIKMTANIYGHLDR